MSGNPIAAEDEFDGATFVQTPVQDNDLDDMDGGTFVAAPRRRWGAARAILVMIVCCLFGGNPTKSRFHIPFWHY